jgi:polysaccharide biosynthesis protein PslG
MKARRRPARRAARRRRGPLGLRRQVAVLLGALLWIAGVTAAILLPGDSGIGPETPPLPKIACADPELGVHSSLAFDANAEHRRETVAAIDRFLRPQIVRESLLWSQIEPVEGRRDWSRADSIVEELRTAGIEPLLVVFGSPPWANGVSRATPGQYVHVPPQGAELDIWLGHYSDFLAAAVRRYRDYVRRWEIWNEPNLAAFWRPRPDPAAYREVYEILRATILRVDPKAEVAVGGLTGLTATSAPSISGRAFLRHLIRTGAPIDNVAIHPYTTDDHPPDLQIPGENNFDDIGRVRDQLVENGVPASIWITEWGWSSSVVGEQRQAVYLDRSLAMLEHRYRFVRVATYFLDHDLPPRFSQGLLDENLEPKPAAPALRQDAERLAARCRAARAAP